MYEKLIAECKRLAALGVDGIRAELGARGIRGRPEQPRDCPLAHALRTVCPEWHGMVGNDCLYSADNNVILDFGDEVQGCLALGRFVTQFDDRLFPELNSDQFGPPDGWDRI
jgi:hypothetical protein